MKLQAGNGTRTTAEGLDETRRLLYMARVCRGPAAEKYELIGTLVNALAHHHPDGTSAEDIERHLRGAVENAGGADLVWVQRQIQRLTEELGGLHGKAPVLRSSLYPHSAAGSRGAFGGPYPDTPSMVSYVSKRILRQA